MERGRLRAVPESGRQHSGSSWQPGLRTRPAADRVSLAFGRREPRPRRRWARRPSPVGDAGRRPDAFAARTRSAVSPSLAPRTAAARAKLTGCCSQRGAAAGYRGRRSGVATLAAPSRPRRGASRTRTPPGWTRSRTRAAAPRGTGWPSTAARPGPRGGLEGESSSPSQRSGRGRPGRGRTGPRPATFNVTSADLSALGPSRVRSMNSEGSASRTGDGGSRVGRRYPASRRAVSDRRYDGRR
jgi:hypothetical protein